MVGCSVAHWMKNCVACASFSASILTGDSAVVIDTSDILDVIVVGSVSRRAQR
jgi:hypothetical protein